MKQREMHRIVFVCTVIETHISTVSSYRLTTRYGGLTHLVLTISVVCSITAIQLPTFSHDAIHSGLKVLRQIKTNRILRTEMCQI